MLAKWVPGQQGDYYVETTLRWSLRFESISTPRTFFFFHTWVSVRGDIHSHRVSNKVASWVQRIQKVMVICLLAYIVSKRQCHKISTQYQVLHSLVVLCFVVFLVPWLTIFMIHLPLFFQDVSVALKDCPRVPHWRVLFHNIFTPSGEQPEQRILAYTSEQPTVGCIAIYHKYCCYIKHRGIITNLTLLTLGGMLLICQNTTMRVYGAWIRIYYILCLETYSTLRRLFYPPVVRDKPLEAPPFVKLAYWSDHHLLILSIMLDT